MAKFVDSIPYLKVKPLARGGYGYYWEPSPALRKAKWEAVRLGTAPTATDPDLCELARAKNREVEAWRGQGASPRAVRRFAVRHTMGDIITRYREHLDERVEQGKLSPRMRNPEKGEPMSANTRKTYETALRVLERWTKDRRTGALGALPAASIDAARVEAFKNILMTPNGDGVVHWNRAHGILRVGRTMMGWAAHKKRRFIDHNPFEGFELAAPPGRDQLWDEDGGCGDIDAVVRAAEILGFPSVGLAVELAEYTGQREADVVTMQISAWQRVVMRDHDLVDRLRGDDAELMGIFLKQGKTNKPIGIPIVRPLRTKIEAAIAANMKREVPSTFLLINESTGRPWTLREFIRRFTQAKQLAVDPTPEARIKGLMPRPGLANLQFRDLRRTRVVRMSEMGIDENGISSITGHSLKTIKDMLDRHYKPRTTRQASLVVLSVYGESKRTPKREEGAA